MRGLNLDVVLDPIMWIRGGLSTSTCLSKSTYLSIYALIDLAINIQACCEHGID